MDLREELGTYEILAIAFVTIGVILLLVSGSINYVAIADHVRTKRFAELNELSRNIAQSASFVLGIGLFMVFRRIYQKLDLGSIFKIINYTYLILVLFSLYLLYLIFFPDGFIKDLYFLSIFIIPRIRWILLAIMFIFVFIVIVKRERRQESDSTPKPQTEEQFESDL
ncbi:MAG: hypothetical protein R6W73_00365 [Candidatus Saliniplasma sp.]